VEADMKAVMEKAQKENKHILVQVGGNWCGWCIKFHEYVKSDSALLKLMNDNYVVYHLNYSQENKNEEYIKKLGYVQRFGFPVFVVLDQKGNKLHIQDSGLLEEGSTYDRKKVLSFFKGWTKAAVDPASYKNF
ncbi:MAG TPA: thioredoxin family protein, partial [Parasegetibacter sp.]